jgi:hypothetical protein
MSSETPDYQDADLILRLYDFRREPIMRQSREAIFTKFHPARYEDLQAVLERDHPLNAAYRQVSSYWEMAAGLVKHGILNGPLFAENCGEALFLYAKVRPFLETLRRDYSPAAFVNIEWVVSHVEEARKRLETVKKRLKASAS